METSPTSAPAVRTSSPLAIPAIGVAGALLVAFITHKFSKRREALTRKAAACTKFRSAVVAATSGVPHATKHWKNEVLALMPELVTAIDNAVREFSPFLTLNERAALERDWASLKKLCDQSLPKALSPAEVMYGGGTVVAEETKQKFHSRLQSLLAHAQQT